MHTFYRTHIRVHTRIFSWIHYLKENLFGKDVKLEDLFVHISVRLYTVEIYV